MLPFTHPCIAPDSSTLPSRSSLRRTVALHTLKTHANPWSPLRRVGGRLFLFYCVVDIMADHQMQRPCPLRSSTFQSCVMPLSTPASKLSPWGEQTPHP